MGKTRRGGVDHPHRRKGLGHFDKSHGKRPCYFCGHESTHGFMYKREFILCTPHSTLESRQKLHRELLKEKKLEAPPKTRRRPKSTNL